MRIFLIFLLLPLKLCSQDLEGVWTGTLYHDTLRKYFPYELAITETKGKISGFSHTIFIDENNNRETGVKAIKVKKKSGKILIEDDDLIYNNYTTPPPKGVRQYTVLNLVPSDSGLLLIGVFNTNQTKVYSVATGVIHLRKKEKFNETQLIPMLEELHLAKSLSFIQPNEPEKKDVAVVPAKAKENKISSEQRKEVAVNLPKTKDESPPVVKIEKDENLIDINEDTIDYKVDVTETGDVARKKEKKRAVKEDPVVKKPERVSPQKETVIASETKRPVVVQPKKEVVSTPVKEPKKSEPLPPAKEKIVVAALPPKVTNTVTNTKPVEKPKEIVVQQASVPKATNNVVLKDKPQVITSIPKAIQNSATLPGPVVSSEELGKRKIETIRTVEFKADSIVLTLYDNGVIDGDTVSVILNGKTIISKKMLTTNALTKTIYVTPDLGDSLQLIMYAENLGSIAPNTGLLIIQDGEDQHQIRFAGDLQKNSAIILRRKRN